MTPDDPMLACLCTDGALTPTDTCPLHGSEYPETYGDEIEIPCPKCQYGIPLQDANTDGTLEPGYVTDCPKCKTLIKITDVDYDITTTAEVHHG